MQPWYIVIFSVLLGCHLPQTWALTMNDYLELYMNEDDDDYTLDLLDQILPEPRPASLHASDERYERTMSPWEFKDKVKGIIKKIISNSSVNANCSSLEIINTNNQTTINPESITVPVLSSELYNTNQVLNMQSTTMTATTTNFEISTTTTTTTEMPRFSETTEILLTGRAIITAPKPSIHGLGDDWYPNLVMSNEKMNCEEALKFCQPFGGLWVPKFNKAIPKAPKNSHLWIAGRRPMFGKLGDFVQPQSGDPVNITAWFEKNPDNDPENGPENCLVIMQDTRAVNDVRCDRDVYQGDGIKALCNPSSGNPTPS